MNYSSRIVALHRAFPTAVYYSMIASNRVHDTGAVSARGGSATGSDSGVPDRDLALHHHLQETSPWRRLNPHTRSKGVSIQPTGQGTMAQSRWAVLLCKFKDDVSEPYGRQRYEDLFTSSGVGKHNMVDFFRDMSHGKLDLSGSQVFGWYKLDKNRADYLAGLATAKTDDEKAAAIQAGRSDLLTWARQAAADDPRIDQRLPRSTSSTGCSSKRPT
jgi:hypothetical protein